MTVIHSKDELKDKLEAASNVSPDHPVVITKFIEGAQEIDVDAVGSNGKLIIHAVSEHVEQAGVHSGDATLVLPPVSLDQMTMDRIKEIAVKVAKAWSITGPFNMQIIKAEDPNGGVPQLKVIECNLRASRSFPFVSVSSLFHFSPVVLLEPFGILPAISVWAASTLRTGLRLASRT